MEPIEELSSPTATLDILAAMITPAIFMTVCATLTLAVSQRLNRIIERTRRLYEAEREHVDKTGNKKHSNGFLDKLFQYQVLRVRRLQRAITYFYIALCLFVLTSVAIGIFEVVESSFPAIPLFIGFLGATALFLGTIQLVRETITALTSVRLEMNTLQGLMKEQ